MERSGRESRWEWIILTWDWISKALLSFSRRTGRRNQRRCPSSMSISMRRWTRASQTRSTTTTTREVTSWRPAWPTSASERRPSSSRSFPSTRSGPGRMGSEQWRRNWTRSWITGTSTSAGITGFQVPDAVCSTFSLYLPLLPRFMTSWWSEVNIVASDFFLSNNLIQESIEINRKRAKCLQAKPGKRKQLSSVDLKSDFSGIDAGN